MNRRAARHPLLRAYRWCNRKRYRVAHQLGYRGLTLSVFGSLFIAIGASVITAEDYRPELVHTHLPTWFRVALWMVPGVVAMITAWDGKWQALGFSLMFIPPAERAVSYSIALISIPAVERLPAALIYILLCVGIAFFASWPEPVDVQKRDVDV
jgi:hypothetical protein